MSVYRKHGCRFWEYDFQRGCVRYTGSTRSENRMLAQNRCGALLKDQDLGAGGPPRGLGEH